MRTRYLNNIIVDGSSFILLRIGKASDNVGR